MPIACLTWFGVKRRGSASWCWLEARARSICAFPISVTGPVECTASSAKEFLAEQLDRHHALKDLIVHGFASVGFPVTKELTGLFRSNGKRPDGLTLVPWQSSRFLCWDVSYQLAERCVTGSARKAGAAAELAASRKEEKRNALAWTVAIRF